MAARLLAKRLRVSASEHCVDLARFKVADFLRGRMIVVVFIGVYLWGWTPETRAQKNRRSLRIGGWMARRDFVRRISPAAHRPTFRRPATV